MLTGSLPIPMQCTVAVSEGGRRLREVGNWIFVEWELRRSWTAGAVRFPLSTRMYGNRLGLGLVVC
jgi:hypothetical protein